MKFGICSYIEDSTNAMVRACEKNNVDYERLDLFSDNWLEKVNDKSFDGFLIRPTCDYEEHKQIYDERTFVISHVLGKKTYPCFEELYVYENKRNMHAWCELYNLPHVKTKILTNYKEALLFFEDAIFPIVSKSNVGAGGSSVQIIKKSSVAKGMAKKIFGRIHPDLAMGFYPMGKKNYIPFPKLGKSQKHYMICQEFVDIKWEWRIIRIGESYFGHQKLLGKNNKASGSLLVGWEKPPLELLNLIRDFTQESGFRSVAIDIFESLDGKFYVNEIQPIIGAYAPSQMYINDVPGRYLYDKGEFVFESGEFCKNECWDLRVEDFVNQLNIGK